MEFIENASNAFIDFIIWLMIDLVILATAYFVLKRRTLLVRKISSLTIYYKDLNAFVILIISVFSILIILLPAFLSIGLPMYEVIYSIDESPNGPSGGQGGLKLSLLTCVAGLIMSSTIFSLFTGYATNLLKLSFRSINNYPTIFKLIFGYVFYILIFSLLMFTYLFGSVGILLENIIKIFRKY